MLQRIFRVVLAAVLLVTLVDEARATEPTGISYGGGTLISHPHVYISYWNFTFDDPAGFKPTVEGLLNHIGNTKYLGITTLYSITGGPTIFNDMRTVDTSPPVTTWSDTTKWAAGFGHPTQAEVNSAVQRAANHFNAHGPDDIIVLATSYNRSYFWHGGDCSYHLDAPDSGASNTRPYIDMYYPSDAQTPQRWPNGRCLSTQGSVDGVQETSSSDPTDISSAVLYHELAECITDPRPSVSNGWNGPNGEIGDVDERFTWRGVWLDGVKRYTLQPLWDIDASQGTGAPLYADKYFTGGEDPSLYEYWNRAGLPIGQTIGSPYGASTSYSVGGYLGFSTDVGAAYETTHLRDLFINMSPTHNEIWLLQDPGSTTTLGSPPPGLFWITSGSPDAATMGWQIVDVYATATNSAASGNCPNPTSCTVFHRGRTIDGWTVPNWDSLPLLPAGVFSGVGAVSDRVGEDLIAILDYGGHLQLTTGTRPMPRNPTPVYQPWVDLGLPPQAMVGDPDLTSAGPGQVTIWLVSALGELWQCNTSTTTWPPLACRWIDYGAPPNPASGRPDPLAGNPTGASYGDQNMFVNVHARSGINYYGGFSFNGPFIWYGIMPGHNTGDHGQDNTCW